MPLTALLLQLRGQPCACPLECPLSTLSRGPSVSRTADRTWCVPEMFALPVLTQFFLRARVLLTDAVEGYVRSLAPSSDSTPVLLAAIQIRRIFSNGSSSIIAGTLGVSGAFGSNIPGKSALFSYPRGLAPGPSSSSDVVIADSCVIHRLPIRLRQVSRRPYLFSVLQQYTHHPHSLRQWHRQNSCGRPWNIWHH